MKDRVLLMALLAFSGSVISLSQQPTVEQSAKLASLRQRAENGDAKAQSELGLIYEYGLDGVKTNYTEAMNWDRKAAEQGNREAGQRLGRLYFEGIGIERDFDEAARWYGCPKPASEVLATCTEVQYKDLPRGAKALLKKLNCDTVRPSNYDYGTAFDLNGDGVPEYQFCCSEAPHGPCGAVLLGKVGTQWKTLEAPSEFQGYGSTCGGVVVLASQHDGFHDICLPVQCSPLFRKKCVPAVWQFDKGRYREVQYTPMKE